MRRVYRTSFIYLCFCLFFFFLILNFLSMHRFAQSFVIQNDRRDSIAWIDTSNFLSFAIIRNDESPRLLVRSRNEIWISRARLTDEARVHDEAAGCVRKDPILRSRVRLKLCTACRFSACWRIRIERIDQSPPACL